MRRAICTMAALFVLGNGWARAQALPLPVTLAAGWQLQDIARVTASGEAISGPDFRPDHWYAATVPGTVLTSLVHDGVYPEPLYGENNRPDKIPESLSRTSYWYRNTFTLPAGYAGKRVWLNFDGINYAAEVWVNGHDLGSIKGAFARGQFDVTSAVHASGANVVAVQILPQPHPGTPIEQTIAAGVGPNGGITAMDGPTFLCSIGWDWIPGIRDRNMGIWQNVRLSASGPVTLHDPYMTSDLPLPRTDTADLTFEATVRNETDHPQSGVIVGSFDRIAFRHPVTLAPKESRRITLTPATTPALHLSHPKLWWPNGYGPQNLYALHIAFTQGASAVSDSKDMEFGVRKITYQVPGSDNLTLSVNGVPVFCKGGDWGMDEAMKRIPRARLDAQIRMHRDANFTMIRNWVGQSTSEDFYELCDKYGILLWDEMFQPNPSDGPNPDNLELYLANVREKILRFRSHPSIAVWCARNEGFPPPNIDAGIRTLMAELERERLYQPSSTSGRGVHSGGPYYWRVPEDFYNVDAPFKTEIGSVSIPTLESIEGMMPAKDWQVINDDWAEHDLAAGAQAGDRFPREMVSRYGAISSLADFVRKGEMATYEAFRAMYEGREAKLFQPATGVLTWMSDPAQPSFVWQIYSYDLEPNAALFASRKACEPVHIQFNQSTGHVQVINNRPIAVAGTAVTSVYNLDGALAYTHTDPVNAAPSAATDLGAVAFPSVLTAVHFVTVALRDQAGAPLSDNFYWRADPAHRGDLTALNQLPVVALAATLQRRDIAGNCLIDVMLRNPTKAVALLAHIQLRRSGSGERVLPVYYSDNYVSLLPGASRTIHVEAALDSLKGASPELVVDGWNVSVRPKAQGAGRDRVAIVPNTAALAVGAGKPASAPTAVSIDAGGGGADFFRFGAVTDPTKFVSDRYVVGGNASGSKPGPFDANVAHAGAAKIYDTERWGPSVYTLPLAPLPAGHRYMVRLHFAERSYGRAGARKFNVAINDKRVLTDFDIFAEAGGANKALVRDFTDIQPDSRGNIVIDFSLGSADQPEIRGIQVFDSVAEPPSAAMMTPTAAVAAPVNMLWNLGTFVKVDAANPIISPQGTTFDDPMTKTPIAWEKDHTFNPAAVVHDGKVCVLYRAEDDSGQGIGHHTSRLGLAESDDGIHFTRRAAPVLYPAEDGQKANEWPGGCEDPRCIETEDGVYVLTYTQWNRQIARLAVATSKDLLHWDKHGPAFAKAHDGKFAGTWSKSGAIVTRRVGDRLIATKINGKYWMLYGEGEIGAATSDNLIDWAPVLTTDGKTKTVLATRRGKFDSGLVEGGPPAVITDKGIVMLYNSKNAEGAHGDPARPAGSYSCGLALLDPKDPTRVLERGDQYFFTPEKPYELTGQYAAGTTFIEGLVHFKGRWLLYYGTADSYVAVAQTAPTGN
jgi:predicted GH43/DUF377 family glycosyl hydrolase